MVGSALVLQIPLDSPGTCFDVDIRMAQCFGCNLCGIRSFPMVDTGRDVDIGGREVLT